MCLVTKALLWLMLAWIAGLSAASNPHKIQERLARMNPEPCCNDLGGKLANDGTIELLYSSLLHCYSKDKKRTAPSKL